MAAKIIKLDEYLENARYKIITATVDALRDLGYNVGVNEVKEIYANASQGLDSTQVHELELELIHALEAHDAEAVKNILSYRPQDQMAEVFKDISVAEDYNFHKTLENEVARNNIMDWLEENGVKYLIDNDGNFAVQCSDRKTHYRVHRQFEHILNKWDNGPIGKNVDPTTPRKALADIAQIRPLTDGLNEDDLVEAAQDGSMPLPDAAGTPAMFPAKDGAAITDGLPAMYENTKEGAMQVLGDLINPSSVPHVEILDEKMGEWLVCDDTTERSYFVNVDKGEFEEVEYICENVGGRGSGLSHGHGRQPDSMYAPKHNIGIANDLPEKDPFAAIDDERYKAFKKIPLEDMANADTDEKKIKLMRHYGIISDAVPAKYEMNFISKFDDALDGMVAMSEANDTAKKRIKKAKDKMAKMGPPGSGMAGKGISANKQSSGAHGGEAKYTRKEKHKNRTDESVLGGATGLTAMPTIGINRLRQLAGLPAATMMITTEVPVHAEEKNEPIIQHGKELHEISDALDHLDEVFNIYKTLNSEDKKELRYNLISTIMDDGERLSESVIDLLLSKDNNTSVLLEFDGDGYLLSDDDKEYLKEVISGIKEMMVEDIDIMNETVKIGLARIAYLLEMLQRQMGETE